MCGIAGIVGAADREEAALAVKRMTGELERRGPDGEGVAMLGDAWLGQRRLAIFDLSPAGAQPMLSEDRSVAVVFNGAIYNFLELRRELGQLGCRFVSATDTEVLLHGYRAWGIHGTVRRLRGMFAFGLWDALRQKLYLVRDRLGVKPLVYSLRGREIGFASTVRALRRGGFGDDLDERAVGDFLQSGFVGENRCIVRGLTKLPPGMVVEWSKGHTREFPYWEPPRPANSGKLSFADAVAETESLLRDAVRVRLHADVPVGVLLSGGIDSALVCWAMSELKTDLVAYTVGVPGDPWDETGEAARTAQRLKIRHRLLEITPEESLDLEDLVSAYDEPFACSSALAMLRVSRAVRRSAKVLLTGDGGDDLFLGYPRHRHLWLADKAACVMPPVAAAAWKRWGHYFPRRGPLRRAGAFMDYTAGGLSAFLKNFQGLSEYREQGLLGPRWMRAVNETHGFAESSAGGMLSGFADYERRGRFVGEYLKKIDGATMHYGLEARSPFLDQNLWEFGSALPFDLRLRGGVLKSILREIARRRIGGGIALRQKKGFRIPVQRWLAGKWFPALTAALRDSRLEQQGWINAKEALAQLEASAGGGSVPETLWKVFILERWFDCEAEKSRDPHAASMPSQAPQRAEASLS